MSEAKRWADMTPEERRAMRIQRLQIARDAKRKQATEKAAADKAATAKAATRPLGDATDVFEEATEAEGGEAPAPTIDEPQVESHVPTGVDPEIWNALTPQERIDIWAEAMVEAKALQKLERRNKAKEQAKAAAKAIIGLTPIAQVEAEANQRRLEETVWIDINLPESGNPRGEIRLDQTVYVHGRRYPVPRAVYETLSDIQGKAWMAEAIFEGKQKSHYNRQFGRYMSPMGGGVPTGSMVYQGVGVNNA